MTPLCPRYKSRAMARRNRLGPRRNIRLGRCRSNIQRGMSRSGWARSGYTAPNPGMPMGWQWTRHRCGLDTHPVLVRYRTLKQQPSWWSWRESPNRRELWNGTREISNGFYNRRILDWHLPFIVFLHFTCRCFRFERKLVNEKVWSASTD